MFFFVIMTNILATLRLVFKYIIQIVFRATRVHVKRKFVVKKTRILQLFRSFCPLCGSIMTLEKITKGMLFILKQQCLQCEYKNQWSGQVDASVLAAEDQHTLTVDGYVSSGTQEVRFKHSDNMQHVLILCL